jgi:hypothetical protein
MKTEPRGVATHLSTGSEYPNSPCGFTDRLVYKVSEVTCPECQAILLAAAKRTLKLFQQEGDDE